MRTRSQRGVVLMIALIMLVAMTLAGLALIRSVDTANLIAGNLAFQQSATNYGDVGTNTATAWIIPLSILGNGTLDSDDPANGYSSSITNGDPAPGESWDHFWINTLVFGHVKTLPKDPATGNTVSYAIHRMCSVPGVSRVSVTPKQYCTVATSAIPYTGHCPTCLGFVMADQVYYRITTRIDGPHHTVSYIQTIAAI